MSTFTKTIIVDLTHEVSEGEYYNTIADATNYLINNEIGGNIIVETGEYILDGTYEEEDGVIFNDKSTIYIPSNTTVTGRGNVVIRVTNQNKSAFINYNLATGDDHITITGFKIVIACGTSAYSSHLIFMQNVSDSVIEKITIEAPTSGNPKGIDPTSSAILFYATQHNCMRNTVKQCCIRDYGATVSDPLGTQYNYGAGLSFAKEENSTGICCDSIVKNNHITGCYDNLYCSFAERITVTGNIFSKAGYTMKDGYDYYALNISLARCKRMIISGNQINDTDPALGSHGLYPSGCEGCIYSGNIFYGNADGGLKIRYAGTNIANNYYSAAA